MRIWGQSSAKSVQTPDALNPKDKDCKLTEVYSLKELHDVSEYIAMINLGCGHGLPGIFTCLEGAAVTHFQDFNAEVLRCLTMPNVNANLTKKSQQPFPTNEAQKNTEAKVRFFAGDWSEIHQLLPLVYDNEKGSDCRSEQDPGAGYDIILMSETVYSISSLQNLYGLIKKCMSRPHGVAYLAAKKHYFGVGGGTRRFLSVVEKDGVMEASLIAEVTDGSSNVREFDFGVRGGFRLFISRDLFGYGLWWWAGGLVQFNLVVRKRKRIRNPIACLCPIFRPEMGFSDQNYLEKRQLFLRSYQFCRKRSLVDRIKRSLVRVKRVIWVRLRSAPKLRRLVWLRLRSFGYKYNRRRFHRLISHTYRSSALWSY
ncbi:hypothetical protein HHK36_026230 [Tetracentron sinense]|uniref:protein-histidine N-methyltransferase n=1 Tax=Tetracentron sinense TaxID=13715 RepID=A0A834YKY6_TETSI|nr:hypothetical protein HHK36_026230 [Tetracentron sinense]